MRQKRIMVIGPGGAGKSTLASWLGESKARCGRTPVMVYGERVIEAPGAYLECPWMHCHLIAAAQDAFCVMMIADAAGDRRKRTYPPGFAGVFGPPVIGVVTKCDLDQAAASDCEVELLQAGVPGPFYRVGRGETDAVEALGRAVAEIELRKKSLCDRAQSAPGNKKSEKGGTGHGTVYYEHTGLHGSGLPGENPRFGNGTGLYYL